MSAVSHHYQERPIKELRGSALLLELFIQWGLAARPDLSGWELYRMCGQQRWLSHNALQGLLDEFLTISGLPAATHDTSPALPWEGVEAPPTNHQN